MPEKTSDSPAPEPIRQPEVGPPPAAPPIELGEGVRKGTHVMPEVSLPQGYEPPTAAPVASAPVSDSAPTKPPQSNSGGGDQSSSDQ